MYMWQLQCVQNLTGCLSPVINVSNTIFIRVLELAISNFLIVRTLRVKGFLRSYVDSLDQINVTVKKTLVITYKMFGK